MEYVFGDVSAAPRKGEILLRLEKQPPGPFRLAQAALADGPPAFVRGEPPFETIVIQADPTLDDMLAATFLERWLTTDTPLPPGAAVFAAYAGNRREGLPTSSEEPQDSLAGVYLAVRNYRGRDSDQGTDLTREEARQRFCRLWSVMAGRILAAAARPKPDPDRDPDFESESDEDFSRARAQLRADLQAYRQLVLPSCERWWVRLQGLAHRVPGLLLREPPSMLWKDFARHDGNAPDGHGYFFLAACEEKRHWRFSIPPNPPRGVSLKGLTDELQKAEAAHDPERAKRAALEPPGSGKDRWFDGARFNHTLVGAPSNGGTDLPDEEVLDIVRRWTQAEPVDGPGTTGTGTATSRDTGLRTAHPRRRLRVVVAAVALLVLGGLGWWLLHPRKAPLFTVHAYVYGAPVRGGEPLPVDEGRSREGFFSTEFDADLRPDSQSADKPAVRINLNAGKMALPFTFSVSVTTTDKLLERLVLKLNKEKPDSDPPPTPADQGDLGGRSRLTVATQRSAQVSTLFLSGAEDNNVALLDLPVRQELKVKVHVSWWVDWTYPRDVYVVAAGVPDVPGYAAPGADEDAKKLRQAFTDGKGEGKTFRRVKYFGEEEHKLPVTKQDIVNGLKWLRDDRKQHELAVLILCGHGGMDTENRDFYFLPRDYVDGEPDKTRLSWQHDVLPLLGDLPCPVLVILDTCHAGAAVRPVWLRTGPFPEVQGTLTSPLRSALGGKSAFVVLAACGSEDEAFGGYFTTAITEAMSGQYHEAVSKDTPPLPHKRPGFEKRPNRNVMLLDLCEYVGQRVAQLSHRGQRPVVWNPDEAVLRLIPVATAPPTSEH
jgi:hypothetical protein